MSSVRCLPDDSLVYPLGAKRKLTSERVCRLCVQPWDERRRLTRHHLIPQSWFLGFDSIGPVRGMRHAVSNIVPLCRDCHDEVDTKRYPALRLRARALLRQRLSQQEIAFIISVRGKPWLDAEYPPAVR